MLMVLFQTKGGPVGPTKNIWEKGSCPLPSPLKRILAPILLCLWYWTAAFPFERKNGTPGGSWDTPTDLTTPGVNWFSTTSCQQGTTINKDGGLLDSWPEDNKVTMYMVENLLSWILWHLATHWSFHGVLGGATSWHHQWWHAWWCHSRIEA